MTTTAIEPPVSESNWTARQKTKDAVEIRDSFGRRVLLAYRVGERGQPGGSEPMDVAQKVLAAINTPKPAGGMSKIDALRAECDRVGVKWHHKHGVERLEQLIANQKDPSAREKREAAQTLPRTDRKGWKQEASAELSELREKCDAAGLPWKPTQNEASLRLMLQGRGAIPVESA